MRAVSGGPPVTVNEMNVFSEQKNGLKRLLFVEDDGPVNDAHWHATVKHLLVAVKIKSLCSCSPASLRGCI